MTQALQLCQSFKSHLRRDHQCLWCGHNVGAPGRHVSQCTPLVQLCVAVAYCRANQDVQQPGVRAQRRGRDLRQLLAQPPGVPHDTGRSIPEAASARSGAPVAGTLPPSAAAPQQPVSRPSFRAALSPAGPGALAHQGGASAGADDQSPAAREGLCPVHAVRGRTAHWDPS